MKTVKAQYLTGFLLFLFCDLVMAEGLNFGLVAKSIDDDNFIAAWRGCDDEAKKEANKCLFIGAKGSSNPHLQALSIQNALHTHQFKALAVSVTASEHIATILQDSKVPVITFDSPFSPEYASLSQAYVGMNNVNMGLDLSKAAKRLRPQGGSICLMTSINDPNLPERVLGIRQGLSGNPEFPAGQRLNGEGGWVENIRCPWNSGDSSGRALQQVTITLQDLKPDVFISVGQWPVIDTQAYREATRPFHEDLIQKRPIMIIAAGTTGPKGQALLDDQLVHAFVSIDFEEIGKQAYLLMRDIAIGKPVTPMTITPVQIQFGK